MPKVLLDLRMVRGRLHGIARYALELAQRLPSLAPSLSFAGLTGPEGLPQNLGPLQPTLPLERCPVGFLSPLEQPALAASLLRSRCDLFHATSFSLPALWHGRLVATLHDANHLALPENYGWATSLYYRWVVGPTARRAARLLTVSVFSRDQLVRHLRLDAARFTVTPLAADARFAPPADEEVRAFRAKHGLPERYFVAVGNEKAHKNLALLGDVARTLEVPLVLLAGAGVCAKLQLPSASCVELPPLDEGELPAFYGGALALLLPSRYEGFGLPLLEAMASGCPTAYANTSALPEVAGEAGLALPPTDVAAWSRAALTLARDASLRSQLRAKGLQRANEFSWQACAHATLNSYLHALSPSGGA